MGERSSRYARASARADHAGNCAGEQSIARTIPRRPRGPDHRGDGEKDGGSVDDPRSKAHPIRPQGPPRDLLRRFRGYWRATTYGKGWVWRAGYCWKRSSPGKLRGESWIFDTAESRSGPVYWYN